MNFEELKKLIEITFKTTGLENLNYLIKMDIEHYFYNLFQAGKYQNMTESNISKEINDYCIGFCQGFMKGKIEYLWEK